ncbi:MAG: leucine-rich repeat protein, partial [Muribaculaceae bacterium]|nr:leucine-rich repeat protein [Muribaculaceae bacterium]
MNKKLSLLIVAAMVSVAATAGTKIYVCGTKITGTTSFSYGNGTVNYDNTTRVLTLNNITYTKSGSSNNGISVDEVDGALTINFTGTNSMTISDADVVLCKSKKLTTINITGATTWLCKSGSHAALKLQDGDVRVEGSGHLYIRHNSGVAVKGGAGTENLTMAITDCEIQSTKQDIYNLKKVAFYWSSYSGRDWYWQGLTYQSRIVLKSYNTTSYAHISSVPTITMNGSMGIKEPSIEVTQNLTAPSNRTKEYIITDAKNDPNKKTDGSFVYEDNGTTARLLGPTADHRFSNPTSIEIPGYVTLNGSLKNVIVGQRACSGMETVKTVTCKYGVTQLEQNAFGYMDALKQVNLPSSLQNIDYAVFTESGTSALNIYWATLNPSNVTINSDAISYMNYTPTLYLPTLAAIEKGNSLTSLTTKCSISSTATPATSCDFRDNSNNGPFYIATAAPSGSTYGAVAVVGGTPSTLTLPASITNPNVSSQNFYVTSIAERAFENNTSVTTANLNNGRLTTIGRRAFYNNSLSSLTTAAATIGDYAFYKGALSSVTLAEGVKTIGAYAFYQGTGVDRLTIPSTVTSIGTGAFTLWSSLRWLTWNAASVSDFTATTAPFAGLGITSFSFGSTVTKIPA